MDTNIEINPGELKVSFSTPLAGKISFSELGLKDEDMFLENGLLRLVIDLEGIGEHQYFKVPTVEVAYQEEMAQTHWQCEFNRVTILDKMDNHGRSTVMLMDRKKMADLEHHHQNKLIIHGEFPGPVHIIGAESYLNLFK